nr:hypothetical protein [Vibrio parahaemolyticus]
MVTVVCGSIGVALLTP